MPADRPQGLHQQDLCVPRQRPHRIGWSGLVGDVGDGEVCDLDSSGGSAALIGSSGLGARAARSWEWSHLHRRGRAAQLQKNDDVETGSFISMEELDDA